MSAGASQHWQELLSETTGVGKLDGSALREYFAPLEDWLRNENLRTGEKVHWLYGKLFSHLNKFNTFCKLLVYDLLDELTEYLGMCKFYTKI